VTIVTDHESGKVVWAREGKSAATLDAFFAELGKERCAQLSTGVCLDFCVRVGGSLKTGGPND
jgi:transposase